MTDLIRLWHGSHRWDPPPEVRPPAKGRAEHGAGIYCCAHLLTAKKYARGGGNIVEMGLRSDLRLLEDMSIKAQTLIDFATTLPRLKKRAAIIQDLEWSASKSKDGSTIGLQNLLNLVVNHDAMTGTAAVEVTHFLQGMGADASLWSRNGGDDWLVVFNTDIIEKAVVRPSASIALQEWEFPTVTQQLRQIAIKRAQLAQKTAFSEPANLKNSITP